MDTGFDLKTDNKVLAAAMLTSFMTTFMSSALNLSIPALESYFSVSAAAISWVVTSYTITVAAFSLPSGKIADITGRRRVFIIGVSGFCILSAACVFVSHIAVLVALRSAMGICGAMIFATNNAILIDHYPSDMRGRMLGLSVSGTYTGLTAGPVIGGILNSILGWRSVFAVSVIISLAALHTAVNASIPTDGGRDESCPQATGTMKSLIEKARGFDSAGTALYIFSITASLYGMSNLGTGILSAALLTTGVAALILLFAHEQSRERRACDPIIRVTMFSRSQVFTFSCIAALMNYGATFAISYLISIYLQIILGMSSGRAGMLLIVMPAVQALFSPVSGSLSDRIRPSILASSGMGVCAAALLMFSRLNSETPVRYIIFTLFITGIGFGLFSSPNTNAILSCVSRDEYGVANSIVATMRTYGQSSGMAILSVLTLSVLGGGSLETSPESDILSLMHISFLVFAVICTVGIFFSLARSRK